MAAPSLALAAPVRIESGGINSLSRTLGGPVGRDIQARGLRVTRQMKANASGRPGPHVQTGNLHAAISFLRFGVDGVGVFAHIGLQNHRMIRRGYNYALILEDLFLRGGAPPDGHYPFIERSLEAAKN